MGIDDFYIKKKTGMKLDVNKDRKEINKIIENVLPLMIKNKNMTQECADCIIVYFIEKIDTAQLNNKVTKTPDLHVKSTAQNE